MTTNTAVKYFSSTMSGAPELPRTAGSFITVLDALISGFGSVTLDSLVIVDNVATATKSEHGFSMVGATGPVIEISGATPSALNTQWRIQSADANTFTFTTSGLTNQTATGTIAVKRAPLGFEKVFSGTYTAAYRSLDITSSRFFLRVRDDTILNNYGIAYLRGYEEIADQSAFDADTATKPFPTAAQSSLGTIFYKAESATLAKWVLVSDGRMLYFFSDVDNVDYWKHSFVFGDIVPYLESDAFGVVLTGGPVSIDGCAFPQLALESDSYLARAYTQTGGAITSARYSHAKNNARLGNAGQAYPSPVDMSMHFWPVEVWDGISLARGMMPGLWNPIHARYSYTQGFVVSDIPQLPGRDLIIQKLSNGYGCGLDITGSWRE